MQGVTLRWILDELAAMPKLDTPLLLMSYLNPLLAFGFDELVAAAARSQRGGIHRAGPAVRRERELRAALDAAGIALVQMVTPVTEPERLEALCAASQGFVYAVTMTGTTGKSVAVPAEVLSYLDRVRAASALPVCAGFGIRSASTSSV